MSSSSFPVAACRSRDGKDPDWEEYKDVICELYETYTLKFVMQTMERGPYYFKASRKIYTTKFTEWGVDKKRIKSSEYQAMSNIKHKRKPEKSTGFELHGKLVQNENIESWETRTRKRRNMAEDDVFSEVDTPRSLTFWTPVPSYGCPSPYSISEFSPTPAIKRHALRAFPIFKSSSMKVYHSSTLPKKPVRAVDKHCLILSCRSMHLLIMHRKNHFKLKILIGGAEYHAYMY